MLGLDFDQAKNLALLGAVGFAVAAVVCLWLIKSLIQKLVFAALLALLAFATWSQRTSLEECADKVQQRIDAEIDNTISTAVDNALDESVDDALDRSEVADDTAAAATTCTFFGFDVTVS